MTWKINGARVYGQGLSINCTNKVTAQELYNKLTEYEQTLKELEQYKELDKKLDKALQQIINIQMTISILQDELSKIHEELLK